MMATTSAQHAGGYQQIHDGIIHLLDTARTETVRNINAIMTATNWEIGRRIVEFEQGGEARAAYGTQLIEQLSVDLTRRYNRGFSTGNLRQIRSFYLYFQHIEIHQTVSGESINLIQLARIFPLPWSAYVRLLSVKNADAGQMNMYLNYAKEHWTMPGENPPVGLILCAGKGAGEAHYALNGLPNTVMASEYKVQLPDEKLLADELIRSQIALTAQKIESSETSLAQ